MPVFSGEITNAIVSSMTHTCYSKVVFQENDTSLHKLTFEYFYFHVPCLRLAGTKKLQTAMLTQNIFQPIESTRLSDQAVNQIKALILQGVLQPGDKPPSERKLMQKLSISRPSLREALRVLEGFGLVEFRPGRGAFVTDTSKQVEHIVNGTVFATGIFLVFLAIVCHPKLLYPMAKTSLILSYRSVPQFLNSHTRRN